MTSISFGLDVCRYANLLCGRGVGDCASSRPMSPCGFPRDGNIIANLHNDWGRVLFFHFGLSPFRILVEVAPREREDCREDERIVEKPAERNPVRHDVERRDEVEHCARNGCNHAERDLRVVAHVPVLQQGKGRLDVLPILPEKAVPLGETFRLLLLADGVADILAGHVFGALVDFLFCVHSFVSSALF